MAAVPGVFWAAEMKLSIVSTLYRSSKFLDELVQRVVAEASAITEDFEYVFVNDGSPDDSLEKVLALQKREPRIVVVDLSRNFGHHHAIMAGLSEVRGEYVFLLDADLEDQPEWLGEFWNILHEDPGLDVVHGLQESRSSHRLGGHLFYRLFNLISDVKIPNSPTTARLMTRRYVEHVSQLPDRNIFMEGLFAWTGFRQQGHTVRVTHDKERSSYTSIRRFKLLFNSLTSFSGAPLQMIAVVGFLISLISGLYGTYLVIRKLMFPDQIDMGYTSIFVSIWFVGGLLMVQLGVIGFYLSRIFREVKNRPRFVIKAIHREDNLRDSR